jgi:formate hydrogenlyase subunit 3/multisubunit Na+/H+ antiporter MnhD subunit
MKPEILILAILLPFAAGVLALLSTEKFRGMVALIGTAVNLIIAALLFKSNFSYAVPWVGYGFEFILRIYQFPAFIIGAAACFGFLAALYCTVFMREKQYSNQFYAYLLISLALFNGATLADNLAVMLFFWEGLLLTLFGLIAIGRPGAFKSATKAFIIVGICDLCMMAGIVLTGYLAGTLTTSKISVDIMGLGGLAFILLMIGAISKAGSMPFHSWIPDAALDAPLPFMAVFPAALEKLLGIYFLTRISLDLFKLNTHSWVSMVMMIVGAVTIVLAVAMALVQKDYKRLLSYHAISQVGYMILGIGTLVPAGIVGGLFHMINNAMYKSCLFLTGGSVEKQAGTTDLAKLGGLWKKMPVTAACFAVAAVSISGVPPFNGFFSKELVYDGALERGMIFYIAALLGSFLTAASFLKLGHAAYLGKINKANEGTKEAPIQMLIPMIVIAAACIVFGVWNALPIKGLIQPILGGRLEGHNYSGFPTNMMLVIATVVVLAAALINHIVGAKISGSGLGAVDHIHHAPVLKDIYNKAEKRAFDPYDTGLRIVDIVAKISWAIDRAIDWVYNVLSVRVTFFFTNIIKAMHTGSYAAYVVWSLAGAGLVIIFLMR